MDSGKINSNNFEDPIFSSLNLDSNSKNLDSRISLYYIVFLKPQDKSFLLCVSIINLNSLANMCRHLRPKNKFF